MYLLHYYIEPRPQWSPLHGDPGDLTLSGVEESFVDGYPVTGEVSRTGHAVYELAQDTRRHHGTGSSARLHEKVKNNNCFTESSIFASVVAVCCLSIERSAKEQFLIWNYISITISGKFYEVLLPNTKPNNVSPYQTLFTVLPESQGIVVAHALAANAAPLPWTKSVGVAQGVHTGGVVVGAVTHSAAKAVLTHTLEVDALSPACTCEWVKKNIY